MRVSELVCKLLSYVSRYPRWVSPSSFVLVERVGGFEMVPYPAFTVEKEVSARYI